MVYSDKQKRVDAKFRDRRRARVNIQIPETKFCSCCLLIKTSTEFGFDKVAKDGLRVYCKICAKFSEGLWRIKNWHKKLINSCKATSKKFNLAFDLTEEYLLELWEKQNGQCYWFNIKLIPSGQQRTLQSPSVDRIDCSKGYTKDNIVLCSQFANLGRCDIDFDTYKQFISDQLKIKK